MKPPRDDVTEPSIKSDRSETHVWRIDTAQILSNHSLLLRSINRPKASTGFTKSNLTAIAAKCCLRADKRVSSPAMDTIGATAIPLLSVPLPFSNY